MFWLLFVWQVDDKCIEFHELWHIGGDPLDQFTIHPNFGGIYVARPLDHEVQGHYNLTVKVNNGAQSATVMVSSNWQYFNLDVVKILKFKSFRCHLSSFSLYM